MFLFHCCKCNVFDKRAFTRGGCFPPIKDRGE
nr:MAG TPA: hypothetical protein [Caudoviricetes sp.]